MVEYKRPFKQRSVTSKLIKYQLNNQKPLTLKLTHNNFKVQDKLIRLTNRLKVKLQYYFIISYKTTNIFFTFSCKTSLYPSKNFILAKASCGFVGRLMYLGKKNINHLYRGRTKTNLSQILDRFLLFRRFVGEYIKVHHENLHNFYVQTIWKIARIDSLLISILKINKISMDKVYEDFQIKYFKQNKFKLYDTFYLYSYKLQIPHGGCRPKKVRRIKKNRLKVYNAHIRTNQIKLFNTETAIIPYVSNNKLKATI